MDFIAWYETSRIWAWIAFTSGVCTGLFFAMILNAFFPGRGNSIPSEVQRSRSQERGAPIE